MRAALLSTTWRELAGAPPPGTVLCGAEQIGEGETRAFEFGARAERFEMFVLKKEGELVAYVNCCPHTRSPLDWTPGRFLSLGGGHILCATHGALFRIRDGFCVEGPCQGASLTPVGVALRDGMIVLDG